MKKYIAILIPLYVILSLAIINLVMVITAKVGEGECWRIVIALAAVILFAIATILFTKKIKEQ